MMKIAFLFITTWVNTYDMFAQHYYGSIRFGKEREDICFRLNKADAAKLNNKERDSLTKFHSNYKVGDMSCRFDSKERLIEEAIKQFKEDPRGYDILLEGSPAVCDPMEMLVGPEEIMGAANTLWENFEEFDGWNCSKEEEPVVEEICDQWDELVRRKL
jgi:hypothetical protein